MNVHKNCIAFCHLMDTQNYIADPANISIWSWGQIACWVLAILFPHRLISCLNAPAGYADLVRVVRAGLPRVPQGCCSLAKLRHAHSTHLEDLVSFIRFHMICIVLCWRSCWVGMRSVMGQSLSWQSIKPCVRMCKMSHCPTPRRLSHCFS